MHRTEWSYFKWRLPCWGTVVRPIHSALIPRGSCCTETSFKIHGEAEEQACRCTQAKVRSVGCVWATNQGPSASTQYQATRKGPE
ncbi:hypothetical protein XELAEV_18030534mg [Xenopus laevis]|uniref:Uncharacterized protein n=1 Tax=Xenopus laevis TaxID=8355 RepID=A0A974CKX5_XENLA|nr:hypothetical protein XELAEV_18030534mg [Xenopus laevis]